MSYVLPRCPHCASVRDPVWNPRLGQHFYRCRSCLCRWDVFGTLIYFAARCPRLTGGSRRPKRATSAPPSELTGREVGRASVGATERLL